MSDIRLVVTDLDGTYLVGHAQLPQQNRDAVIACNEAGIPVVACTGRCWTMAAYVLRNCGLDDWAVISNGAAIKNSRTGEVRNEKRIEDAKIRRIMEAIVEEKLEFNFFCRDDIAVLREWEPSWTRHLEGELSAERGIPEGERAIIARFDSIDEMMEAEKDRFEMVRIVLPDDQPIPPRIQEAMGPEEEFIVTVSYRGHRDISDKAAGKANALNTLADMFGVTPEQTMALGDSGNDVHMLQWAGLGVSMGDGHEVAKQAADIVTVPADEFGFAKAVYEHVLGR